jgi:hypothetical protein
VDLIAQIGCALGSAFAVAFSAWLKADLGRVKHDRVETREQRDTQLAALDKKYEARLEKMEVERELFYERTFSQLNTQLKIIQHDLDAIKKRLDRSEI